MRPSELDDATLFRRARAAIRDYDRACRYLAPLHDRGTRAIFDRAAALCTSADPDDRLLGVCVLRELGHPPPPFAADAVPLLLAMLDRETKPRMLRWVLSALGWQHMSGTPTRPRLEPTPAIHAAMLRFAQHPDAAVRFAVASELPCVIDEANPEPDLVAALVHLGADPDADTRYYALSALVDDFSLHTRREIRDLLTTRATDPDPQIRTCALRVLAGGTWAE
jgi:hypothetical protein